MVKNLIVIIIIIAGLNLSAQGISIFFLKDGSIVQGKVVNENQNRIFLKTEQGTIKILPTDIIGREDAAKNGDLTFFSDRLEYLQNNVSHLSGQLNHWNDSLKTALGDLHLLFRDLEVLQNEFEIDLLRLHSQGREQKKKLEYVENDLVNQRVNIATNRQEIDDIDSLSNHINRIGNKLDITSDQSYLLSGNLSAIKKDIQETLSKQQNQQNQIDMMAGALANNIQEVIRVQGKFGDVEDGVSSNKISLEKLNISLDEKTNELSDKIRNMLRDLTSQMDNITFRIDDIEQHSLSERKKLTIDLNNLQNELEIVRDKVNELSKNIRINEEKIRTSDEDISALKDSIKSISASIKKMNSKIEKLKSQVDDIPIPE